MALTERLALLVTLDAKQAIAGLEKVGKAADKNLSKATQRTDKMGQNFQKVGVGMAAAGGLLAVGLFKAAQASEEANLAVVKLENSLKNNPKLAGESSAAFIDLADSIQDKTAADGDAIVAGQAMLATFKVTGDQIRELTPLVVDYARKFGTDLVTANAAVGKALDGSVGALKRNGVSIDEVLFKTDRYAAVQKALAEQVGGFAEAEGKTFAGSLERLQNQLGDLVEGVGGGAVEAFSSMLSAADPLVDKLNDLDPAVEGVVGKVAAFGSAGLIAAGGLAFVVGKAIELRDSIKNLPKNVGDLVGGLSGLKTKAAVAAVGIGLLAYVAFKASERADKLAAAVENLRDEAEDTGDSLGKVAERQLVDTVTASSDARDGLEALGLSYRDLRDPLHATESDFESWRDGLVEQARAQGIATSNVEAFIGPIAEYRNVVAEAEGATVAQAKATADMGLATEGAIDPTTGLTGATDDLGGGMDGAATDAATLAEKIKEVDEAFGNLLDATLSQFDADLAYQGAINDTEDALLEVQGALQEHGGKSEEYRRATLEAKEALLDQADAAAELQIKTLEANGVTVTAAEKQAIHKAALEGVRDTLLPGSSLRTSLDGYIGQLDKVPATIRTKLLADAGGAFETVNAFLAYIKAAGFTTPLAATATLGFKQERLLSGERAAGGPVASGGTYLVGERGPELLHMGGNSGSITPNHAIGMGGGNAYSITVNSLDPRSAGKIVVDAIQAYESSNGKSW